MQRSLSLPILCLCLLPAQAIDLTTSHTDPACHGGSDGTATVTATNGAEPYEYLWGTTPPQTGRTATGLAAGTYTITVRDAIGDSAMASVTVGEPPPMGINTGGPTWACSGGCATIAANVNNPSAPPYTFQWSHGSIGPGPHQVCLDTTTVHVVTVTDGNGCTATATAVVHVYSLFVTTSSTPASSCTAGDGSMTVTSSGGDPPFTYTWNTTPVQTTPTATSVPAGTYTVTVTDAQGCIKMETVTVDDPSDLRTTTSSTPADCGANGTATVFVTGGTAPYAFLWNTLPQQTTATATHLAEGNHSMTVTDAAGCRRTALAIVERRGTSASCGSISGTVYADLSGDCVQDPGEPGIPRRILMVQPGGLPVLTDANGAYSMELEHGAYTLDATMPGYDPLCPSPMPHAFALDATTPQDTIDVAMDPLLGPDVRAFLSTGAHRPGFTATYRASVHNNGLFSFNNLSLDLLHDPLLTLDNATGSPTVVGPGHLRWDIPSLGAFGSQGFVAYLLLPPDPGLIGSTMTATATVVPSTPDADPSNDSHTITSPIIGAYDPNDKLAMTSSRSSETIWFLDRDDHVDYTIRFQNTGNAEAIDVYVTDTISSLHDLTSLKILGASHDFEASLLRDRVLRFDFPNIMLPDSNSNEPESHGFVSFRLRPVNGLQVGDRLTNEADIFFDFNPPIRTNTTELTAEFSVGVPDNATFSAQVFPNPVGGLLQVKVPGTGAHAMEVFSLDGRIAMRSSGAGPVMALPVDGLPAGVYVLRVASLDGTMAHARFVKD